jgi:hypothetical protein
MVVPDEHNLEAIPASERAQDRAARRDPIALFKAQSSSTSSQIRAPQSASDTLSAVAKPGD